MRLSELADRSGTSIPTIKYYIREGLLPPGRTTSPRQAEYDDAHLGRLRLVRALVDVGGLSLAAVRDVLAATAEVGEGGGADVAVDVAVGVAHAALGPRPGADATDGTGGAHPRATALLARLGWEADPAGSAVGQLEAALAALEAVGLEVDDERVRVYGDAAMAVAEHDVGRVPREADPVTTVTSVVLGTVLYEPLLLALRRLAQSDAYRRLR